MGNPLKISIVLSVKLSVLVSVLQTLAALVSPRLLPPAPSLKESVEICLDDLFLYCSPKLSHNRKVRQL